MRWLAALLLPLRRARVAGAEADGDDAVEPETGEGLLEILADVVGEGAQRRDVEAADALGPQAALVMLAGESVDDPEEAGERFPRSRGRGEQHRSSRGDVGKAEALAVGGTPETLPEPRCRGRVEAVKKSVVGIHGDGYGGAPGPARRGWGNSRAVQAEIFATSIVSDDQNPDLRDGDTEDDRVRESIHMDHSSWISQSQRSPSGWGIPDSLKGGPEIFKKTVSRLIGTRIIPGKRLAHVLLRGHCDDEFHRLKGGSSNSRGIHLRQSIHLRRHPTPVRAYRIRAANLRLR